MKLDNLAAAQYRAGHFKEAVDLLRRALSIREKGTSEKHRADALNNMNNLAAALGRLRKFDEAEAMFRIVLAERESALGCEHMDSLVTANYLGVIVKQQKRLAEAEKLLSRALSGFKKLEEAGCPLSPIFSETSYNYAVLCVQLGQRRKAGKHFGIAHKGLAAELGADNPHTLDALDWEIKCMSDADFSSNASQAPEAANCPNNNNNSNNNSCPGTGPRNSAGAGEAASEDGAGDSAREMLMNTTMNPMDVDDEEVYKSAPFGGKAKQCELCNRSFKVVTSLLRNASLSFIVFRHFSLSLDLDSQLLDSPQNLTLAFCQITRSNNNEITKFLLRLADQQEAPLQDMPQSRVSRLLPR